MKSIKIMAAAIALCGMTACGDNTPQTFTGFITDASMNTVTVENAEGTFTFSTMDADKSEANGLLLGAPVVVDYKGKLEDGAAAAKVATDPTYAEAVGKWTMPDPIAPEGVMGIDILIEGQARSINMATLRYKKIITKPLASFNRSTSRNRQFSSIFNHYNTTQDIFLCFESFFSC